MYYQCEDPAQPLTTVGEELDNLDHDLSVDDLSVNDLSELWNSSTHTVITPLGPQSRFGDKLLGSSVVCTQNGTGLQS